MHANHEQIDVLVHAIQGLELAILDLDVRRIDMIDEPELTLALADGLDLVGIHIETQLSNIHDPDLGIVASAQYLATNMDMVNFANEMIPNSDKNLLIAKKRKI